MRLLSRISFSRCCRGPDWLFAAVFVWKVLLLLASAQPVPANDSFFYDGAVVNLLLHGNYANPSLSLALPIAGTQVFSAYPPLYQMVLWPWMCLWGTSAMAAMTLHLVLFGLYLLVVSAILRRLQIPSWCAQYAGAFLFAITFHDRPDSLAHLLGMLAVYAWVRSRPSLDRASPPREAPVQPASPQTMPAGAVSPGQAAARWAWAASGFLVLGLCTSLQIGAIYLALVWLGMMACRALAKDPLPVLPMAMSVLVPVLLVVLVAACWPQLWAGFLEHARQTPSLTGWRRAHLDELLKVFRSVPGVLVIALSLPWLLFTDQPRERGADGKFLILTSVLTLPSLALVLGCLTVVTPNMVGIASYLQPLAAASFLAYVSTRLSPPWKRAQQLLFLALALLVAIRALGMTTWGLVCATDYGYRTAMSRVRHELGELHPGATAVVSAAYLYESAQHADLNLIHSDWLHPAARNQPTADFDAIRALKPQELLLTQFDYYRRYQEIVNQLRRQTHVVRVQVIDTARVPPPDASHLWQRVIQHVSWAPIVVKLEWR
jgi:hypothetical protein